VVSHPSHKNKGVARMGHPVLWLGRKVLRLGLTTRLTQGEGTDKTSSNLKSPSSVVLVNWVLALKRACIERTSRVPLGAVS
jgi:hypothetical protein